MVFITKQIKDERTIDVMMPLFDHHNGFIAGGMFKDIFMVTNNDVFSDSSMSVLSLKPAIQPMVARNSPAYKDNYDSSRSRGGRIKRTLDRHVVKDADVYFASQEDYETSLNTLLENGFEKSFNGKNSTFLRVKDNQPLPNFDLVKKYYGTVEEVLNTFDFTVAQCAVSKQDDGLYLTCSEEFLNDLQKSQLRYSETSTISSENTLERTLRYVHYGFDADEATIRKSFELFCSRYSFLKNKNIDELVSIKWVKTKYSDSDALSFSNRVVELGKQGRFSECEWKKLLYYLNKIFKISEKRNQDEGSLLAAYEFDYNIAVFLQLLFSKHDDKTIMEYITFVYEKYDEKIETFDFMGNLHTLFSFFKLLRFFEKYEEKLDREKVQQVLQMLNNKTFMPSFRGSKENKHLIYNSKKAARREDVSKDLSKSMDHDVVLKTLMKKNDKEWWNECLSFFAALYEDDTLLKEAPTLEEWHKCVSDGTFDPSLPPHLMFGLMIEED